MSHPSKKSMLPKASDQRKKKTICEIFHQKKIQKVLMKIEEMADVFLNSANFAKHTFSNLAPPSQGQPTTCSVQFVNHSTYVKNYFCAGCKVLEIFTRSAEKVIEISKSVS